MQKFLWLIFLMITLTTTARGKQDSFDADETQMTSSLLDDLPKNLSVLQRTQKVIEIVVNNGFKCDNPNQVIHKVEEELHEVQTCISQNKKEALEEELGDLLLATITLCVYLQKNPERTLEGGLQKFEERFRKVEQIFKKENKNMKDAPLEELLNAWKKAK